MAAATSARRTPPAAAPAGTVPANRAVPANASTNAAIVAGWIRSPRRGTAKSVPNTAYSGATKPVMVGPAIATAMFTPTMNRMPPSRARVTSRISLGRVIEPTDGAGSTPATARPTTITSARVHDSPATARGEKDRIATAVAG